MIAGGDDNHDGSSAFSCVGWTNTGLAINISLCGTHVGTIKRPISRCLAKKTSESIPCD